MLHNFILVDRYPLSVGVLAACVTHPPRTQEHSQLVGIFVMNKRDFVYATSILRTIRQRIKAGWKHEAQEDIDKLQEFLNERDYELTKSNIYGFAIRPLENRKAGTKQ